MRDKRRSHRARHRDIAPVPCHGVILRQSRGGHSVSRPPDEKCSQLLAGIGGQHEREMRVCFKLHGYGLVPQRSGYGMLSRDTALDSLHRDNEFLVSRPVLDIESLTICIEIYV